MLPLKLLSLKSKSMASKSALPPLQFFLLNQRRTSVKLSRVGIFHIEKNVLRLSRFPPIISSEHLLTFKLQRLKVLQQKAFY